MLIKKKYIMLNKKKKVNFLELSKFYILPKDEDDYSKIFKEFNILVNYERSNKLFVKIDDNLWGMFVHHNYNKN